MTHHDLEYLNLLNRILNVGIEKEDRTGTGTRSVFGHQMRFNLRDGTIPLLTTKKMFSKAIIHELLWFISGSTDVHELQKHDIHIWDAWQKDDGTIGPSAYGHQWTSWDVPTNQVVLIEKKYINLDILHKYQHPSWAIRQPAISPTDNFIGQKYNTPICGRLIVLDKAINCDLYTIQFLDTGFIKSHVEKNKILRGTVHDPYAKIYYDIGYMGEYDAKDFYHKVLFSQWKKILDICYGTKSSKESFVHPHWHCYANFQYDVKRISNWNKKIDEISLYQLDKDYWSSNCYSKQTCIWSQTHEHLSYKQANRPFYVTTPSAHKFISLSVKDVCNQYGLSYTSVVNVLKGRNSHTKRFKFNYIDDIPSNMCYRYKLPINQLENVIKLISNNPDSRRIIVTSWRPDQLDDMALPPCHCFYQFYVANGELSLKLTQRSCDAFLGVPFNIAQYSILLHMVAKITKLKPGDFVWSGGDVHLYNNHYVQAAQQLIRSPYPSPMLRLHGDQTDIDDFQFSDFEIIEYNSHPTIKAKVSV